MAKNLLLIWVLWIRTYFNFIVYIIVSYTFDQTYWHPMRWIILWCLYKNKCNLVIYTWILMCEQMLSFCPCLSAACLSDPPHGHDKLSDGIRSDFTSLLAVWIHHVFLSDLCLLFLSLSVDRFRRWEVEAEFICQCDSPAGSYSKSPGINAGPDIHLWICLEDTCTLIFDFSFPCDV